MEGNSLVQNVRQWPVGLKDYFLELQTEMRRVTWPTRKQVQATTGVVVVTVFAFAAYFAVIDSIFSQAIKKLFSIFTKQ